MFALDPGVVMPLLSRNDSLSVGTGSRVGDVAGVICATYTVVACCLIVMTEVDSSEAEAWEFVVF